MQGQIATLSFIPSSSIIPALCIGLAWPDCSRGRRNRFGYRFYGIGVFCCVVAVVGWQLWYLCELGRGGGGYLVGGPTPVHAGIVDGCCINTTTVNLQQQQHNKTLLCHKTCSQTSSVCPENNPVKPNQHRVQEWYCCYLFKSFALFSIPNKRL